MESVTRFYERIAKKNGLIATGGSDAHGKIKPHTYVGKKTVPMAVVEQLRLIADETRQALKVQPI